MHPIAISNDMTVVLLPMPFSVHPYLGAQGYVPLGAAFDLPVPMYWPPGFALGTNKMTMTVLHKGMPVVLDGHDCGTGILHVQVAPDPINAFSVMHLLFSSRKLNFFTSKEIAEGQCVGIAKLLALPPAPMTSCGEPVSFPGTGAPTTTLNSTFVEMTLADMLIGWGTVAATQILEIALAVPGFLSPPGVKKDVLDKLGLSPEAAVKQGLAVTTGIVRMAATDGPASIKATAGNPYFRLELGVSRDERGDLSGAMGGRALHYRAEVGQDQESFYLKTEERSYNDVFTIEQRPGQDTDCSYHELSDQRDSWGRPL